MEPQQHPNPEQHTWLLVIETPIPGVLLAQRLLLEQEPAADPEVGWTTTDDNGWE